MKVKIKQLETLHREVEYIVEIPDNWSIPVIAIEHGEELDNILSASTPQFGQETIIDVETQFVEKL